MAPKCRCRAHEPASGAPGARAPPILTADGPQRQRRTLRRPAGSDRVALRQRPVHPDDPHCGRAAQPRTGSGRRGGSVLVDADADRGRFPRDLLTAAVSPTAINMRRVATMMGVVDRAQDGPLELEHVTAGIAEAEAQSVSGTAVFVLACATGAAALSIIYGASQPLAILLVALAAAAGGLLRRWSGALGAGPLVQVFGAALIAGAVGAAATHLHLGASTAVVAICPAMVLVPGPHILNGALDLLDLRVTLGSARLAYGLLVLTAISGGLILGLHTGGQMLAVTAPSS